MNLFQIMSKRCSASTCFNSLMTNKSVQYFCYPKHEEFARKWAELAQRDDIGDKPLQNIIKYYLCSAHFDDSCFSDPPANTRLIRSIRPFYVPMPTIFAPEADYGTTTKHEHQRSNITVSTNYDEDDTKSSSVDEYNPPLMDVPQQLSPVLPVSFLMSTDEDDACTETATVIAFDDLLADNRDSQHQSDDQPPGDNSDASNYMHTLADIEAVITEDIDFQKTIVYVVDNGASRKNGHSCTFQPKIRSEPQFDELLLSPDHESHIADDELRPHVDQTDINDRLPAYEGLCERTCRLCAQVFDTNDTIPLFDIFTDLRVSNLCDDLQLILPPTIQIHPDDGRPQRVCPVCQTKATDCARVLREFRRVQERQFSIT